MTNDTSRITKVTTRNGDTGQTRLATNIKVSKADPWVRSLGSTDELNSAIGLLRCHVASAEFDDMLAQHQQLMFDIGAVLAMGGGAAPMDVFKAFRGREPTVEALLRHNRLLVATEVA